MARKGIVALAIVFLAAHLAHLPPTLEDIDSVNFALAVRDFDVARHQPHPPGYPLFVALAKASTPALRGMGVTAPEARGIAVWSAISGAALVLLLFALFRVFAGDERRAGWATLVAAFCPLFWFTALRPLSDTTGLAVSVAAQVLIAAVILGRGTARSLVVGAFLAGLGIGFRSQSFLLTLPLLGLALVLPRSAPGMGPRIAALGGLGAGVLAWAIPLVIASGGLAAYSEALGTQAGEDFSGVVMLWNMRTARVAADALQYSFLWPWGHPIAGVAVLALAAGGALRSLWRAPLTLGVLLVAFVPYAIFHLLFHEVVTVRYALPLVVPIAYLVVVALDALPRRVLPVTASASAVAALVLIVPATRAYARDGSPAFAALRAAGDRATSGGSAQAVGFHAVARRAAEWLAGSLGSRVLKAPHGREWLTLVEQWRAEPRSILWFVADPRRTDLALFDPTARELVRRYRWGFVEPPFVGGARPGDSDLYRMAPPGWMLDRGWALTPEVAGTTTRDDTGPHRRPSIAWIRARDTGGLLLIGGRHLGAGGDPPAHISLTLAGRAVHAFDAAPGFFFQLVPLAGGTLSGADGYLPLEVTARPGVEGAAPVRVGLEQFDLQPDGVPMVGAESGWQEPEFNPLTYRSWRWTTERAVLWVRPIGRDLTLTLSGESPLRYFDAAPEVTVTIGSTTVARFNPPDDFTQEIVLPAAALAASNGRVIISSSKSFIPAERDGGEDKRHLALRIYSYAVK